MKNPFYSFLAPALLIGVTILGFFLLKPAEPTPLFWIDMVWSIALEILFFVWLRWGRLKPRSVDGQTVYYRIFLGVGTLYYIIAAVIWMIVFSIFGTKTNIYLFGILILTVLWIVIASIMGRHDAVYGTQQAELVNATGEVRDVVAKLKQMAAEHQTDETKRAWNALIREAESTPPRQMAEKANGFYERAEKLI